MAIIDVNKIRLKSWNAVRKLGFETTNPSLPLMEETIQLRTELEICSRLLCLLPISASAYGFPKDRARAWLENEGLMSILEGEESDYINSVGSDADLFKQQIEGMWALAWLLKISNNISPIKVCSQNFVRMLPDLNTNQPSSELINKINLRPINEIVQTIDLYYCLHWAIRQRLLDGMQPLNNPKQWIVEARRRGLEWSICDEPWWQVSLDT